MFTFANDSPSKKHLSASITIITADTLTWILSQENATHTGCLRRLYRAQRCILSVCIYVAYLHFHITSQTTQGNKLISTEANSAWWGFFPPCFFCSSEYKTTLSGEHMHKITAFVKQTDWMILSYVYIQFA